MEKWPLGTVAKCIPIPLLLWAILAVTSLGSGCAGNPEISSREAVQAKPSVLEAWNKSPVEAAGPKTGPLTLERAIDEATKASPELEQIRQRIEAAAEQVKQADAAFYPRLTFSEEFNDTNNPVFALMNIINQRRLLPSIDFNNPGTQQNFGTRIKGEWSLLEGGSHWYMRKAALGEKHSIEANLRAGRNQLISKVTETYYRWLQALSFIGVAERALESAKTNERLGEARVQAEAALPSELARLRVRTAEANNDLLTARTGARRLQAALERLLARPIHFDEIPDPALFISTVSHDGVEESDEALTRQALENRPELAAVHSLIQASRNRLRSAQGGLLPRIGASAQYEVDSEDLGESADSWMVGVMFTWPFFEGGATLARIREARAHLKEVQARGDQVALDIALEVHQATLALQESAEKIRVAAERTKWARKALEEVRFLYRDQVVGVDSLLESEVAWAKAEASYNSALFEGKIAGALLRQALGDFAKDVERGTPETRY